MSVFKKTNVVEYLYLYLYLVMVVVAAATVVEDPVKTLFVCVDPQLEVVLN